LLIVDFLNVKYLVQISLPIYFLIFLKGCAEIFRCLVKRYFGGLPFFCASCQCYECKTFLRLEYSILTLVDSLSLQEDSSECISPSTDVALYQIGYRTWEGEVCSFVARLIALLFELRTFNGLRLFSSRLGSLFFSPSEFGLDPKSKTSH